MPVLLIVLFASLAGLATWFAFRRGPSRPPEALGPAAGAAEAMTAQNSGRASVEVPSAAPPAPVPTVSVVGTTLPKIEGPLARFFAAAEALKHGTRTEPVRILWLGDSHTAADFWPDAVRRPLSERFGTGGPGFLYLGALYRHAGARMSREGEWRVLPDQPALPRRQEDGVFGLGGIRAVPQGPEAKLVVSVDRDAVRGDAMWDLAFRLPEEGSGFRVQGEGMKPLLVDTGTFQRRRLQHIEWRTPAPATVTIDGMDGAPEFFGVVVEGSEHGIVLDGVGIIGARVATPLSWDAPQWIEEARRRNPTVVVLAYGTNESGDGVPPARYAADYEALMRRVRRAAPQVDCLIAGPTDREVKVSSPGRVRQISSVQERAALSLGCAFFSTQEAMGGEGGFTRWAAAEGAFTSGDGVHLAPNGYAELGAQMVRVLLSERPGLQ
ncbi:MAG TPA: GDSL-type esterase/lipase family protein [Polyangiaceae bacterium]